MTLLAVALVAGTLAVIFWPEHNEPAAKWRPEPSPDNSISDARARTEANYGAEIDSLAKDFNLPASYLKALIVLECSGKRPAGTRAEKHVFHALQEVREGTRKRYGHIKRKDIVDATDQALENLATSWGPFQLMGYQCVALDVMVADVRGPDGIYWGIVWIDRNYGKRLRKGQFKDAFHIHNTGRTYPKNGIPLTHDPSYVKRGLEYIDYFESLKQQN